jgi:hypothetical protein
MMKEQETGMASKKAAKKAAKKGAKKAGHKHDHEVEKDLRRAYEHLGRLDALEANLPKLVVAEIHTLTEMARMSLLTGDTKSSAELLRGCEHLAFGAMASNIAESVGEALQDAIVAQYERLLEKAADRWDEHDEKPGKEITAVYEKTLQAAETAYNKGAYRKALELVRAAEAMTHVELAVASKLEDGKKKKKLKG